MKIHVQRLLCGLLTVLLALSAGCLKARSLDQYGYVLAIGFDKGEKLPYKISLLLQNTQLESDSQRSDGFTIVDAECRNLYEAMETLSAGLPYQLDFARTNLIVIQQELAKGEKGIEEILDISFAQLRIRYNANLFLALDGAGDVLKGLKNDMEPNLTKMNMNFQAYSQESGLIPVTNITLAVEGGKTGDYDFMMPLCGAAGKQEKQADRDSIGQTSYAYLGGKLLINSKMDTTIAGAALFSGYRMVGVLDGQRTMLVMMTTGEFRMGRVQLENDKGEAFVLHFRQDGKPAIRFQFDTSGIPRAIVSIPLVGQIDLPDSCTDTKAQLEAWTEEKLRAETELVFAGCQAMGADVFCFGKSAVKAFSSEKAWEAYDWKKRYPTMEAAFLYHVTLMNLPEKSILE